MIIPKDYINDLPNLRFKHMHKSREWANITFISVKNLFNLASKEAQINVVGS